MGGTARAKLDRRIPLALRLSGELVVIVAGVLIALWVDNLNQDRRDVAQEAVYIRGILVDLESDSVDLAARREVAIRGRDAADRLLALRLDPGAPAPVDSLAPWMFHTAFVDNFQVLDHTYREVLGAGGLSLIRDEGIRRRISAYYRSIESAEFFTDWYKGEETAYWDLLGRRLHPDDFKAVSRSMEKVAPPAPDRLLAILRSDSEIINAIEMNRHWTALRQEITERRLESNRELASQLAAYLEEADGQ